MNCKNCGSKDSEKELMKKLHENTIISLNLDKEEYKFDFKSLKYSNGTDIITLKTCSSCDEILSKKEVFLADFNKCSCGSHVGFLKDYEFKRKQGKNIIILNGKCSNCRGNIRAITNTDRYLSKRLNQKNWL